MFLVLVVNVVLLHLVENLSLKFGQPCGLQSEGVCMFPKKCSIASIEFDSNCRQPLVCCSIKQPGDISRKKCHEYEKYCYKGPKMIAPTIIGGEGVKSINGLSEFPHMAAIGYQKNQDPIEWRCGGSLISSKFVLTAAHCLDSLEYGRAKYVIIGVQDLKNTSLQPIKIAATYIYPKYTPEELYNDIGLIMLPQRLALNPQVRPACLYPSQIINVTKLFATGFGRTHPIIGPLSDHLNKVVLTIFGNQFCNKQYANEDYKSKLKHGIIESQFCAGSQNKKKHDICDGDSGGPLQISHGSGSGSTMYQIVGITSFGLFSCALNASIFTRVASYIDWIEHIVWPHSHFFVKD